MGRGCLAVLVLLGAGRGLAQEKQSPVEILVDPGPGKHGEPRSVALPPEGPERDAVLQGFIRVDTRANEAYVGSQSQSLSAYDFYTRAGRPDLAARADERTRQRVWMIAGSVVTLAASATAGAIVLANAQSLNDPACFVGPTNVAYNDCVERANRTQTIGVGIILAGVTVAASLLTVGILIPEMVTTPDETVHLAVEHNRTLARKHGAPQSRLELLPAIGPGYQGLTARLAF
jgi:hypothetical protein